MIRADKEPTLVGEAPRLTFKIDELESPKALDLPLSAKFLTELLADGQTQYRIEKAGHLSGELASLDRGALLRGELTATVVADCGRCLTPVVETLTVPLVIRYVSSKELRSRVAREDDEESNANVDSRDLDEEPFDGQRVDLRPALREQLILALPMRELCREDCQGLCPQCGKNRNETSCNCKPQTGDPRWQQLKDIKI